METTQIVLFVLASLAVIITPGQDLLLVLSRAVTQGSRAGIITASGVRLVLNKPSEKTTYRTWHPGHVVRFDSSLIFCCLHSESGVLT